MVTYTISRAFHMIRYGEAKMRCVDWNPGTYLFIRNGKLVMMDGGEVKQLEDVPQLRSFELLGNWVEVK